MRHLWSFLAGIVVAPLTWVLVTLGQDGSSRTVNRWVELGTFTTANLIEPAVYLAVAGILAGLLGTLRISPLGPLVAGLLLTAPYVGLFVNPFNFQEAVPTGWKVLGDPLPLRLPVENGTLFVIGLLLVMATFSGQRWRRWPVRVATTDTTPVTTKDDDGDDDATLTDWSALKAPADPDVEPPTLGYPTASDSSPLPRREGTTSPWSAPPAGNTKTETN